MTPRPSVVVILLSVMIYRDDQPGDHLHQAGRNSDGRLELTENFDFAAVDRLLGNHEPEDSVSWSDMVAAFCLVLEWLTGSTDNTTFAMSGARCHSLIYFLNPTGCRFDSLEEIAMEAGCTRAALSKSLLQVRDQLGMHWTMGKRSFVRESCRRGQLASVDLGTHASCQRKRQAQLAEVSE